MRSQHFLVLLLCAPSCLQLVEYLRFESDCNKWWPGHGTQKYFSDTAGRVITVVCSLHRDLQQRRGGHVQNEITVNQDSGLQEKFVMLFIVAGHPMHADSQSALFGGAEGMLCRFCCRLACKCLSHLHPAACRAVLPQGHGSQW